MRKGQLLPEVRRRRRVENLIDKHPTGCWGWTGATDRVGYGKYDAQMAHRVVYEYFAGQIPAGLELDHLCQNRTCVRPDHLEPVTGPENIRRWVASITHCKRGHEFTAENTYLRTSGRRACRACVRARAARHQARRVPSGGGAA